MMIIECPECRSKPVHIVSTSRNPIYKRNGKYVHMFRVSHFQCDVCGTRFAVETFMQAAELINTEENHV